MSASTIDLRGAPGRQRKERMIRILLQVAGAISILISFAIVVSLVGRAVAWLGSLDTISQLWAPEGWRPVDRQFDVRTILIGTLLVTGIGMVIALPLGLSAAIYLSEYAKPRVRRLVKPILEILAGIPSVVLGFFALTFITPEVVQLLFGGANRFNAVSAGIAVGILISPLMASISEDALRAVPNSLREASYGLGARKRTTVLKVVLPAAVSGIVAAFIVTISRAVGETLVVTLAASGSGSAPFNADPLQPTLTMTAAIAQLATGSDAVAEGPGADPFESLYFVGLLLFSITLALNVLGDRVVRRFRKAY